MMSITKSNPAVPAVLEVRNLCTSFLVPRQGSWGSDRLHAVNDVSFLIPRGKTLGLVGESGCGKSSLGRTVLGLEKASQGDVLLNGVRINGMHSRIALDVTRQMQVVFQDPYSSLDPRMNIHDIIAEPLRIHGIYDAGTVDRLMQSVGIAPEAGERKPGDFSGGQRQRIAIARALALKPDLIILDEAVSALDVSVQAQILNLLKRLQDELGVTYLFISHDLSVVRHISDEVAVMYLGRIVEHGTAETVFDNPQHPYTRALLSAAPVPDPRRKNSKSRIILKGDLPSPINPPSGCVFRTRCYKAQDACAAAVPALRHMESSQHSAACFFPDGKQRLEEDGASRVAGASQ